MLSLQNQYFRTTTGIRTAIRGLVKCQFLTGLPFRDTYGEYDGFSSSTRSPGEAAGFFNASNARFLLSGQNSETTSHGTVRARLRAVARFDLNPPPLLRGACVRSTHVSGAGRTAESPDTQADLQSEHRTRHRALSAVPASKRSSASAVQLAWDATGTQFGQRQLQLWRYYRPIPCAHQPRST